MIWALTKLFLQVIAAVCITSLVCTIAYLAIMFLIGYIPAVLGNKPIF